MKYFIGLSSVMLLVLFVFLQPKNLKPASTKIDDFITAQDTFPVQKSDEDWEKLLTPEQYEILREGGTEKPFDNKYEKHKEEGIYVCAACEHKLFASTTKYESFCGWPSFWDTIDSTAITTREDNRYGMTRTEIVCANCGGHLGHVFDDGPPPTGLRYCLNSAAMNFIPLDSLK